MNLDIYSIGDGQWLFDILNATAAIFASDDFAGLIRLGLLLGVLVVCLEGLRNSGRSVDLGRVFTALLFFAAMIVPRATVNVIDVYTSTVRPVANVPLGLAAVGSIFSSAGYHVTRLFETAFAGPAMTQRGFGDALETLKRVRLHTLNEYKIGMVNSLGTGVDVTRSWQNYIKECTFAAVKSNYKSLNAIINGTPLEDQLEYVNPTARSEIYIGGAPLNDSCQALFTPLRTYTHSNFLPELKAKVLAPALRLPDAAAVTTRLNDAMSTLGITGTSADDYIVTTFLIQPYFLAATEAYQDDYKWGYSVMVDDAIRGRNSQWMAQQSMFESYVQPMLTFLEGFVYAVAPLVVFAAVLGLGSLGVAGKLVMVLLWIQLWLPCLAIVNYFLHSIVAGRMDALAMTGLSIGSMSGLFESDDVLQYWLATGGLIASSIPALSLLILYGGAVSASAFAGRIGGPDTVSERQAAPLTFTPFGMNNVVSPQTTTPTQGRMVSGGSDMLATFTVGTQDQRMVESSARQLSSATAAFAGSLREAVTHSHGSETRALDSIANSVTENAGSSATYANLFNSNASAARSIQQQYGLSEAETVQAAVAGSLGLQIPPGRGVSGGVDGSARGETSATSSRNRIASAAADFRRAFDESQQWQAAFTRGLAHDLSSVTSTSGFSGSTASRDADVTRRADDVVSAERGFSDAASTSFSMGAQRTVDGAALTRAVLASPGARQSLDRATAEMGLDGAVDRSMATQTPGLFAGDRQAARVYAQLEALGGLSAFAPPMDLVGKGMAQSFMNDVYRETLGQGGRDVGNAFGNEGLADRGLAERPPPGGLAGQVRAESGRAGGSSSAGALVPEPDFAAANAHNVEFARDRSAGRFADLVAPGIRAVEENDARMRGEQSTLADSVEGGANRTYRGAAVMMNNLTGANAQEIENMRISRQNQAVDMGLPAAVATYYGLQASIGQSAVGRSDEDTQALASARARVAELFPNPQDQRLVVGLVDRAAENAQSTAAGDLTQIQQMLSVRGVTTTGGYSVGGEPSSIDEGFRR